MERYRFQEEDGTLRAVSTSPRIKSLIGKLGQRRTVRILAMNARSEEVTEPHQPDRIVSCHRRLAMQLGAVGGWSSFGALRRRDSPNTRQTVDLQVLGNLPLPLQHGQGGQTLRSPKRVPQTGWRIAVLLSGGCQ